MRKSMFSYVGPINGLMDALKNELDKQTELHVDEGIQEEMIDSGIPLINNDDL